MPRTHRFAHGLFLGWLALVGGIFSARIVAAGDGFPPSTASAEGLSPEALKNLDELVRSFVEDEEIVGGELLVIKNGRTVLHEAYGFADREAERSMEVNSVFCVRSMTKPLIGTAILMLIDDGQLKFEDPVARYLPTFDAEGSRDITIQHLLGHTSGLPMSLIMGKDLHELDGIQDVANLGGGHPLAFDPGAAFSYSDQGTDTLTAVVEVVTDAPVDAFIRDRILDPLGMSDSLCVMEEEHPLRERGCAKYMGVPGDWTRFWAPQDAPLFPFFLGSQGLYSTTVDYARFLDAWRLGTRGIADKLLDLGSLGDLWGSKKKSKKGSFPAAHLLRKALTPGPHPMASGTGLPGATTDYGYLMQLWTAAETGSAAKRGDVLAFGHTGSDGTHAWCFPEQNGMALYFTQSRGTSTGLRVEEALGDLFLGVPYDPAANPPPLDPYLGYYFEGEGDLYRAVIRDGEDLALEILGKGVVTLAYVGDDKWKFRDNPSVVLDFQRSETGEVTGYEIGNHREFRIEPRADLPSATEIAGRVAKTHRLDLIESVGPLRMNGTVTLENLGITGKVESILAWPGQFRFDFATDDQFERVAFDGAEVHSETSLASKSALEGPKADAARVDHLLARMGDWSRWYPTTQVIQQIERGGQPVYVIRAGDLNAPAQTLYVSESGRVLREDGLVYLDGMGRMGQRITFGDYRDTSGMLLPFRTEVTYPNPILGTSVMSIDKVELEAEIAAGTFSLSD